MTMRIEVWALPLDGPAVPLPDLAGWDVTPSDVGDWGAVKFEYPVHGRNYAAVATVGDDDGTDLRIEIALTDSAGRQWLSGGYVQEIDTDDVAETGVAKCAGVLDEVEFGEAVMPYHPTGENGETTLTGTAGQIMRGLLEAAQARGWGEGITWTFTDSHDSNGVPWANTATLRASPGQHYAAILGTLRGYQLSEWEFGYDRVVRLTNVNGKGVDRTVAGGPVPVITLEHGRDLGDAPRKRSWRGAFTALLAAGKDGLYSSDSDPTARAQRGRRIEGYTSFGSAATQGTLDALTSARLATKVGGTTAVSHKIVIAPNAPLPLLDYGLADWVLSATRRGVDRRRVVQITVSGSGDTATGAAVALDAVIDNLANTSAARLDALTSGEAIVGTSQPPPEVDDGSTPVQVTGLTVTSLWYRSGEGVGLAAVLAGWADIPDDRVVGYAVEWRYTLAELGTGWRRLGTTDAASIEWSAVVAGAPVQVRVAAINKWDRLGPWSAVFSLTTQLDGTPPPVASGLSLATRVGQVWGTWNGRGAAGEAMPADFLRAEVHRSTTNGFTPSRPLNAGGSLNEQASTTYRGDMRTGMTFPDQMAPGDHGTTFYYRIVTVDRTHNAAAASAQTSIVAVPVQDGEVATISAGKIIAGIIDAVVGIGQRLYAGDPNGPGWEGDPAGFRFYTGTGGARRAVLEFIASTGVLTVLGRILAGAGIGVGPTVDVSPSIAGIDYYPNATTTRIRQRAFTGTDPGGSTGIAQFITQVLDAAGVPAGPAINMSGTNIWLNHRVAGIVRGARMYLGGPGQTNGAILGYIDPNTGVDADVRVFPDGEILFSTNGADIRANRAMGSGGAGFSFKAQGGDSQGYRAYVNGNDLVFVRNSNNQIVSLGTSTGSYKTFVIPHPVDPDRWLVHVAVEAPEAQIEHRGVAEIIDGAALVELPDYWDVATVPGTGTVHLTMQLDDEPVVVLAEPVALVEPEPPYAWDPDPEPVEIPESARVFTAGASTPAGGRFRIASPAPDGTRFAWIAKATRADGPPVEVEPLRDDVVPHGEGPYRYLTRRTA